ncbi:MAG: efflux RND transporter periplasmic adaptor subunit [Sedimentisphaerales bacterium]|nr:efflux RND transporter periplasmic adaptor subunit [Sedimentisphaerales bacterium]
MAGKTKKYLSFVLRRCFLIVLLIAFFALGYIVNSAISKQGPSQNNTQQQVDEELEKTIWTCSMHPQIRQSEPGKCPLCLMDLIPLKQDEIEENKIEFSEAAMKLMEIETSPVERKFVTKQIRLSGKIDYDETRIKYITSWITGRIERLFVDYTGIKVNKDDHMVIIYSPQLISAQAELLQALKAIQNIKPDNFRTDSIDSIRNSILATRDAAREKLRLLGLKSEQIAEIEKNGEPVDHITIYSPIGGVVIDKNATEGMYVETGTKIYTVADLSQVWVKLDAYESDMMWIRYGQEVEFSTEAYPGEVFNGKISFIEPVLNPETRTVKIRLIIENPDGKLKPDMFVRAIVNSKVAKSGMIMDEQMAGKWICPMHLNIVKDSPGTCDICEMDLVKAESLGFVTSDEEAPLVVPASAVLITGKRAIVYVQIPDAEKPAYEGREITLGPRTDDYYIVESGLKEGEIVVTNGNFKIDSEMQIRAKPSMMNSENTMMMQEHSHSNN